MVTSVRFRDRTSGRVFEFWNTLFDHQSEPARQHSAELLRDRIPGIDPDLPVVLVGDFNAVASHAHTVLTGPSALADTWPLAKQRKNEEMNTSNSFREGRREGRRIDWILARPPVKVDQAEIVIYAENGVPRATIIQ